MQALSTVGSQPSGQSVKHSGHWCVDRGVPDGQSLRDSWPMPGLLLAPAMRVWLLHDLIMLLLGLHRSIGFDHSGECKRGKGWNITEFGEEVNDLLLVQTLNQKFDLLGGRVHFERHLQQCIGQLFLRPTIRRIFAWDRLCGILNMFLHIFWLFFQVNLKLHLFVNIFLGGNPMG